MAVQRMRLGGWVAVLAAVTLLSAGCGDDSDNGDAPAGGVTTNETTADTEAADATDVFDRDACELLTDDQVAEVLGDGVTKEASPGDATIAQPATCTWSGPDATVDFADPQPTAITVFLGDRQIYDNTQILAENGETYEELDGVGDEAYAGDAEGGVLVGEAGITVTPIGTDANDPATHDLVVELLGLLAANA
jgi:hypothetical protein